MTAEAVKRNCRMQKPWTSVLAPTMNLMNIFKAYLTSLLLAKDETLDV